MNDSQTQNSNQTLKTPDWTFKDVSERLRNLYASHEFNFLNAKKNHQTFLHAMRKSRSETICSSLLAWVFDNYEFNYHLPPIVLLLRALAHNSVIQENKTIDSKLRDAIITNDFELTKLNVILEEKNIVKNGKKGFLDLMLVAKIKISEEERIIRILIENKIDSTEHHDQCKRYLEFFSKNKSVGLPEEIKDGYSKDKIIDFFVFLSIIKPKDSEIPKDYIFITHQEVVDCVLLPILALSDNFSSASQLYLQEFYDMLTSLRTGNKMQIAMDAQTQKILKDFYINNQEIINAAVLAGCQDEEITKAITANQKSNSIRYSVKHPQWGEERESNQNKLLEDIIKILLKNAPRSSKQVKEDFRESSLGKFLIPESDSTTGYGESVEFTDGKFRVSTQKARYKSKEIMETARKFGFEIDSIEPK